MRCKLAGVNDMIAAVGKYHLNCYCTFLRKFGRAPERAEDKHGSAESTCFEKVMGDLQRGIARGSIYSLKSVWDHYAKTLSSEFNEEPGIYRSNRFKEKVKQVLGQKVAFIQSLNVTESILIFPSVVTDVCLKAVLSDLEKNVKPSQTYMVMNQKSLNMTMK